MVHCLATAVVLGLLASAGGMLGAPWIHEVGLTLAMVARRDRAGPRRLDHGFLMPERGRRAGPRRDGRRADMPHDGSEALYTIVGVAILALGHQLNRIAAD